MCDAKPAFSGENLLLNLFKPTHLMYYVASEWTENLTCDVMRHIEPFKVSMWQPQKEIVV